MLDRDVCLAAVGGKPEPASSKSRMLKRLPLGWRDGFLDAVANSAQYAMPCALLDACGLRPVELEKRVAMEMKGERVQVRIEGGKVRDGAGQPWRQFELTREALPAWAYDKVKHARLLTVSADPDALRAFIGRVSEKLFPRHDPPRANDILLSAYVFRHALVSDLRAEGWDSADIAAVIGESSAQTTKWYGVNWGNRDSDCCSCRKPGEARSAAAPAPCSSITSCASIVKAVGTRSSEWRILSSGTS